MIFDKIKSIKDYAYYWSQVESYIAQRDHPFKDNSEKAIRKRKTAAEKSIWAMAPIYFPDYVHDKGASFHPRWGKISRITNEPILIEAFRGAGKSTFFSFLDPVHAILFNRARYLLISSYTWDPAPSSPGESWPSSSTTSSSGLISEGSSTRISIMLPRVTSNSKSQKTESKKLFRPYPSDRMLAASQQHLAAQTMRGSMIYKAANSPKTAKTSKTQSGG